MTATKSQNVQDVFLNNVRKNKTPVTVYLISGVKLQGIITWFDNFSVLLRRDGQAQLIYKHAISTIMPSQPLDLGNLQDAFDEQLARKKPSLLARECKRRGALMHRSAIDALFYARAIFGFAAFCPKP